MHEGTELVAAIGVALEHVEGGSAGRKEDDFAGCASRVGALDGLSEREAISHGTASFQSCAMRSAISPIKTAARTLRATSGREHIKSEALVLAAGDQHDRIGLR